MTEPTDAEIVAVMRGGYNCRYNDEQDHIDFARAVLAKWGTQPQAGAVPQGWKAVPVNPTPEMWKAAKTVPDPNPPYPPHHGLVWDAMLAASPTPTAEQKAGPGAVDRTGCTAGTDEECTRRGCATSCPAQQAAPKTAPVTQQAGYAEVIECGNSYAKVKLKGEAFGSVRVGDIFYTAPQPMKGN